MVFRRDPEYHTWAYSEGFHTLKAHCRPKVHKFEVKIQGNLILSFKNYGYHYEFEICYSNFYILHDTFKSCHPKGN